MNVRVVNSEVTPKQEGTMERFRVFAKSAGLMGVWHYRSTRAEALELGAQLARTADTVEVERLWTEDDPEEGPVTNSEVIWTS